MNKILLLLKIIIDVLINCEFNDILQKYIFENYLSNFFIL